MVDGRDDRDGRPDPAVDLGGLGFDASDAWTRRLREAERPAPPETIGPFEQVEMVGQGAQGIVYRARERASGRVVALKRLPGGAGASPRRRARFEREAIADARLSHPNIVRVSALTDIGGHTCLCMDWIEGLPVDRWVGAAEGGRRGIPDIVRVFLKICDAVRHAHQRGVIHRDLKPSNILVDRADEPHVLDFGLARLLDGPGVPARLTRSEGFVGTLAYAAPEQLRPGHEGAGGADVRTDVYALGAVLYQLLTGHPPHEAEGDLGALLHAIQHDEPAPPSSANRAVGPDLDAILARALAKEKERRYQSADALGADIRRFLAGEPVGARRASRWYLLRRRVRRHRVAFGVAGAIAAALAGASAVSTVFWVRARAEEQRSAQVAAFLRETLASIRPDAARGADAGVMVEVLDRAGRRLETELGGQPGVRAELHTTLGHAYAALGLLDPAEAHLRSALSLREAGRDRRALAQALHDLAHFLDTRRGAASAPEARVLIDRALAMRARIDGRDHPLYAESLETWASCRYAELDWAGRERVIRRVLAVRRKHLGDDHHSVARAVYRLGQCAWYEGDFDGAAPLLSDALARLRRALGEDDQAAITAEAGWSEFLADRGHAAQADAASRAALEHARRVLPSDGLPLAFPLLARGRALLAAGNPAHAEPFLREAADLRARHYEPGHWRTAEARSALGECLTALGRFEEAEPLVIESYPKIRSTCTEADLRTRQAHRRIESLYSAWDATERLTGNDGAAQERSGPPAARR